MRFLVDLESALAGLNVEALARFDVVSAAPMAKLAEDLSRRRSLKAASSLPSFVERQVAALRRFRRRDREPDFRTLRLACLACALYVAEDDFVLLADATELDALLAAVGRYAHEPRRFRRLFDVLLRAYLGVDRDAKWFASVPARLGNERLREFLEANFANVQQTEPTPEWVRTLAAFPEILSDDPGRRFADSLLAGASRELDKVCHGLGITGASWLVVQAVRSATKSATAQDDGTFVSHIPALLDVAAEPRFAPLRDETYAALVTRHANVPGRPVHAQLRDALIAAWKNPWLERNDSAWGRVSPDARKMVAGWLKLDLIHQFFDVLSDDRGQDRSRFEFWSKYHERMDDVYIALGSSAYYSARPDLVKLRNDLEGRLLKLHSAGADTNAFIMFMGNDVIVEFSQKSNAAYRYKRNDSPIDGTDRIVTIPQLKRRDVGDRMLHARGWQIQFSIALGTSPVEAYRSLRAASKDHVSNGRRAGAGSADRRPPPFPEEVAAFARRHNLPWADHRSRGGSLWVFARNDGSEIARQLKVWGFGYRDGRGWWRAQ